MMCRAILGRLVMFAPQTTIILEFSVISSLVLTLSAPVRPTRNPASPQRYWCGPQQRQWPMPPAGAKRRKVEIGARKQRRVGWLTLANIPCARAVFAGVSQGLGLDMPSETSTVCADLEVEKLRRELAQVQELQTAQRKS